MTILRHETYIHTARDNLYFCVSLPTTNLPSDRTNEVSDGVVFSGILHWPWMPDAKNVINRTSNNNT